jgi:hypothetical protein
MNKFVFGALAVTTVSSLGFAGNGEDWMTLDREIESLTSGMAQGGSGFSVDGWVKSSYASSGDVSFPSSGSGTNDLGGFSLDSIRVNFDGSLGDFDVHVALEGSSDFGLGQLGNVGNAGLVGVIDAYGTFSITDQVAVQVGFFRPPFLNDSLRDEDEFLFIDRTVQGDVWAFRDQGVMFSFSFDQFSAWLSVQNGVDAQGDELAFTVRAEFNAMGAGMASTEGAYGANDDENNLNLGAAYYDDGDVTDGSAFSFDVDYSRGPLYAAASIVGYDKGFGFPEADSTPWDVTVSYMVAPDEWEIAGRWEDFDDSNDSSSWTLGVNYYVEGHDMKWQLNYSSITSDASAAEIDVIAIAMLVSV